MQVGKQVATGTVWCLTALAGVLMLGGILVFLFAAGDLFGFTALPTSFYWQGTILTSPGSVLVAAGGVVVVFGLLAAALGWAYERLSGTSHALLDWLDG